MSDKCEILFTSLLHLERLLQGERLHRHPDCTIENSVENMERSPAHVQTVVFCQVVDTATQNVVLGNDLLDIECVLDSLYAVCRRTIIEKRVSNGLIRPFSKRSCQFHKQSWDVIVQRRDIEILSRGQSTELRPPFNEQPVPLVFYQPRKFF